MRKERRAKIEGGKDGSNPLERTTVFLTRNIHNCLEVLAIAQGRTKGEVMREILEEGIKARGLDTTRRIAKINVDYK